MLIVPAENRPDWSRPPVATLALILVNCLVFFVLQTGDGQRMADALASYHDLALHEREAEPYREWIEQRQDGAIEALPVRDDTLAAALDPEFGRWLRREPAAGFAEDADWQWRREQFEQQRDRISYFSWGLIPADNRPLTYLTSQFLHGGFGHLLGNMVFLFLFGFALEVAIGRTRFVALYLISGVAAGGAHVAAEWGSAMPVIGASGAVSGLMGMYLALYGWRRIDFFYWIAFYYNYFRAPAVLMLPVWLGKEIYEALFTTSQVAYWAHAGGMAVGFLLLAAWRWRGLEIDRHYMQSDDPAEADRKRRIERFTALVQAMELEQAQTLGARLVAERPDDLDLAERYLKLLSADPDAGKLAALLGNLSSVGGMDPRLLELLEEVWTLWCQATPANDRRLEAQAASRLLVKLVWGGRTDTARSLVAGQIRAGLAATIEPETLSRLAMQLESSGSPGTADKLRQLARRNQGAG